MKVTDVPTTTVSSLTIEIFRLTHVLAALPLPPAIVFVPVPVVRVNWIVPVGPVTVGTMMVVAACIVATPGSAEVVSTVQAPAVVVQVLPPTNLPGPPVFVKVTSVPFGAAT